ncbi:hypothetical protein M404DRAFT_367980 [Pisolithus tinctorius Marx 270]|uniref:Uncharacterized protein n=1 Tax=Pisolithus tinctorius Marx 270 TaxID=870435 RepID=A0A0C3NHE5_PISTI|nr:hypothetical protein M404DRAFT_367980 [Pisolithus tinctorius Marx 270]
MPTLSCKARHTHLTKDTDLRRLNFSFAIFPSTFQAVQTFTRNTTCLCFHDLSL